MAGGVNSARGLRLPLAMRDRSATRSALAKPCALHGVGAYRASEAKSPWRTASVVPPPPPPPPPPAPPAPPLVDLVTFIPDREKLSAVADVAADRRLYDASKATTFLAPLYDGPDRG